MWPGAVRNRKRVVLTWVMGRAPEVLSLVGLLRSPGRAGSAEGVEAARGAGLVAGRGVELRKDRLLVLEQACAADVLGLPVDLEERVAAALLEVVLGDGSE